MIYLSPGLQNLLPTVSCLLYTYVIFIYGFLVFSQITCHLSEQELPEGRRDMCLACCHVSPPVQQAGV